MKESAALRARHAALAPTIFAEMSRLAAAHDAVNLSQGFPDFAGPRFLKTAAIRAIEADHNQYAPMRGVQPLVTAIADDLKRRRGLDYDPSCEVTVFSGATEAIHCALMAFTGPGDEVLLLEPFYDSYVACCALAGSTPRYVTLHGPEFRWDEKELRAAFNERTKLVMLNTPHNPTGRVFSRNELALIAELCREHDVLCVTDEVYDRLVYEGEHISMASLDGMGERTITINSTGKTFSLTGWKIGYATAPVELSHRLGSVHQFVTFAVATPLQHAMVEAITAPTSYFDELQTEYKRRRDYLMDGLRATGLRPLLPAGSYFIMADIRPLGYDDDVEFCRHLVEEIGVAAIPPSALYAMSDEGRHYARFCFAKRDETLCEAVARLASLKAR
jgi:N-succinyldiaminopimelate aminotransferase